MSLSFLCPVPAVRNRHKKTSANKTQTTPDAGEEQAEGEPSTFSRALKERTRVLHSQSDALVNAKMGIAFADRGTWTALLVQFGAIYTALEDQLAYNSEHPVLAPLYGRFFYALNRTRAFEEDLAYFQPKKDARPPLCSAAREYVARIEHVGETDVPLLLAYAQTMYMALLSGGQVIRRLQRGAMRLPSSAGGAIFEFKDIPAREQKQFKREFAAALDALSLDAATKEAIIQEKQAIFPRNDHIIKEVVSSVPMRAYVNVLSQALIWLVGLITFGFILYNEYVSFTKGPK